MQFFIDAKVLSNALGFVGRAINARPSYPVLACVLVEPFEDGFLTLTGFDLSTGLVKKIDADVESSGKVAIPHKLFSDIVSKLSGELIVSAIYDEEQNSTTVKVKSESGEYSFAAMDAEDFPGLTECIGSPLELPADILAQGLERTIPFASIDETKQVLTGVRLSCADNSLEFAATNGHVLGKVKFSLENDVSDFAVTLPSKSVGALSKMEGDLVKVTVDHIAARFECGDSTLVCRLLEGSYPQYNQLIPVKFAGTANASKRQLLGALDRLNVLADQKSQLVSLEIFPDKIIGRSQSADVGNGVEKIPAESNVYEPIQIGFNNAYLINGLKVIGGDFSINFNANNQPVVFKDKDIDFTYLVMPVQLVR